MSGSKDVILVTGGEGFIGSHMVKKLKDRGHKVVIVDKRHYCSLNEHSDTHVMCISDDRMRLLLTDNEVDIVINFAAETHVDRSFKGEEEFVRNNVLATTKFLLMCRDYGKLKKFIHISTDEVYGRSSYSDEGCKEDAKMDPTNPYSGSKAAAELMITSIAHSYNIPIIITRGNNVYGPGQYPEKLIPKFIVHSLIGIPHTIHGKGRYSRSFIYVTDTVNAIYCIYKRGKIGEAYNIGSEDEFTPMYISKVVGEIRGVEPSMIFIEDRPYNDERYNISCEKLKSLGWVRLVPFVEGMIKTFEWYENNLYSVTSKMIDNGDL